MKARLRSIALAACASALLPIEIPQAVAKQQCSSAAPSATQGRWWSYRIIDGRKCWYEGKPMLAKSLLEWPKSESKQANAAADITSAVASRSTSLLNSQASTAKEIDTFDARWRARIGDR
ncbi:hypothetical protein [Bradyrhizobium iriomotense]|uniref:Uncharacterized protein n=1 Tax=Bradyrhizobium iriomotense TaxID=441950 RepID=A0ABQ6BG13_9BRAD|nr:hypothetical protein [Bradyrhizobium iriomotense]GLR91536.1 hypothetical protein GCM10007857_82540 [Bradyrhizobium iriomotense]